MSEREIASDTGHKPYARDAIQASMQVVKKSMAEHYPGDIVGSLRAQRSYPAGVRMNKGPNRIEVRPVYPRKPLMHFCYRLLNLHHYGTIVGTDGLLRETEAKLGRPSSAGEDVKIRHVKLINAHAVCHATSSFTLRRIHSDHCMRIHAQASRVGLPSHLAMLGHRCF